jgi:N-acetylglucosaminyldiphosphoundecaprenol N-acetyl-beta-D-mannosaminyltransferase
MDQNQTHIIGTKIDLKEPSEVRGLISRWLTAGKQFHHIVTLNPEICLYAERHESYRRRILNKAELTVRDGFGLVIGAKILGTDVPARITGRQLASIILTQAQKTSSRIYFLGGDEGVADKAAKLLKHRHPQLSIVGAESGPLPDQFSTNTPNLVKRINDSEATILFVAFGAPKQEEWIAANRDKLKNVIITVGIGGLFNYLAGNVSNPSPLFRKLGLEWLFRLFTQKKRFKRVFNAVIVFPYRSLVWALRIQFRYRFNVIGAVKNQAKEYILVSPTWSPSIKWQFPQGGVDAGESAQAAILREMSEELGTEKLSIRAHHPEMYTYDWPKWYQLLRGYKGQRQDLFFVDFTGTDKDIDLTKEGELSSWKWSPKANVMESLAPARREIGKLILDLDIDKTP